jgi:hypothetical protein
MKKLKQINKYIKFIFYKIKDFVLLIIALMELIIAALIFAWPYIKWTFIIGIIAFLAYISLVSVLFLGGILLLSSVKTKR